MPRQSAKRFVAVRRLVSRGFPPRLHVALSLTGGGSVQKRWRGYVRRCMNLRDIEERRSERGVTVTYETLQLA